VADRRPRQRNWSCPCGAVLGVLSPSDGGYTRLWPILAALDRIEVEGYTVRLVCARCQQARIWHTERPQDDAA